VINAIVKTRLIRSVSSSLEFEAFIISSLYIASRDAMSCDVTQQAVESYLVGRQRRRSSTYGPTTSTTCWNLVEHGHNVKRTAEDPCGMMRLSKSQTPLFSYTDLLNSRYMRPAWQTTCWFEQQPYR